MLFAWMGPIGCFDPCVATQGFSLHADLIAVAMLWILVKSFDMSGGALA